MAREARHAGGTFLPLQVPQTQASAEVQQK
jgi:hypothetical protein